MTESVRAGGKVIRCPDSFCPPRTNFVLQKRSGGTIFVHLETADIECLWSNGLLGDATPESLLLTLHLGLRGRDEHYMYK